MSRALGRDVHIFDASDPTEVLGGLVLTNGVTNANLYSMVEIICIFSGGDYFIQDQGGTTLQRDGDLLQPGNYYILTDGSITVNDEPWLVRTMSVASGTRAASFRDAVRGRDRRCVITGNVALNAQYGNWKGFEAAHIFPLAYEGHWKEHDYGRWITIPPAAGSINSVQNGILLRADIHALFDSYDVSVNPDDNHKIVCFTRDGNGIAGRRLDQQFLDDPSRPVDQLLRWHFRQAVLANMRGAGEPVFELDFPPGSDIMGEIMEGPKAAERLEFEFFTRLAGVRRVPPPRIDKILHLFYNYSAGQRAMHMSRSLGRNVHIYDANDPAAELGGLILTNGVTNANFYSMVEIICIFDRDYDYLIRDEGGTTIERDDHLLQPGNYYILTNGSITVNNEPWLVRTMSVASGTRVAAFRDAVRDRDRRCVITGEEALDAEYGIWRGFEAAHIFPLAYEGHWVANGYGSWITIQPGAAGSINSVQNGILLRADIHALFDGYDVSINPDDNHKIVCFRRDGKGIAGTHLGQRFLDDPRRPVDQLLRWHFRQAVLANMRGAGEPIFEFDFPPGSDMIGEIMEGPKAAERLEFEFFSRLAGIT